ncbi:hypothetical protein [Nocardia flavorosea]|nr:hypothetical protein [Nocardia flavorosea]
MLFPEPGTSWPGRTGVTDAITAVFGAHVRPGVTVELVAAPAEPAVSAAW